MDANARLNNLRDSYHLFHDDVLSALRVMVGDPPRLNAVRDRALALASAAELVRQYGSFLRILFESLISIGMSFLRLSTASYRPHWPTW
jgi:hypothetical protein